MLEFDLLNDELLDQLSDSKANMAMCSRPFDNDKCYIFESFVSLIGATAGD